MLFEKKYRFIHHHMLPSLYLAEFEPLSFSPCCWLHSQLQLKFAQMAFVRGLFLVLRTQESCFCEKQLCDFGALLSL